MKTNTRRLNPDSLSCLHSLNVGLPARLIIDSDNLHHLAHIIIMIATVAECRSDLEQVLPSQIIYAIGDLSNGFALLIVEKGRYQTQL